MFFLLFLLLWQFSPTASPHIIFISSLLAGFSTYVYCPLPSCNAWHFNSQRWQTLCKWVGELHYTGIRLFLYTSCKKVLIFGSSLNINSYNCACSDFTFLLSCFLLIFSAAFTHFTKKIKTPRTDFKHKENYKIVQHKTSLEYKYDNKRKY